MMAESFSERICGLPLWNKAESMEGSRTVLEEIFSHDLPELKAVKAYNHAMRMEDEDLIAASFRSDH